MAERLLDVDDLHVTFVTEDGLVRAVDGVSFTLDRGEVVAIVGESGSGKSVTAMTLMGLTRSPNSRFEGSAKLGDRELVTASEEQLEKIRGKEIAMIFQDPISSLSPVQRIGDQIVEQIRAHEKISKAEAMDRTVDLMERVGIPRARDRARAYPHEFSGGMRQRVDDRDGALALAQRADRRRAHDGARRDHPGADPARDQPAQRRQRQRHHLRHPRSRSGR